MTAFRDSFEDPAQFDEFSRQLRSLLIHHGLEGVSEEGEVIFDSDGIVRGMEIAAISLDSLFPEDKVVNRELVLLVQNFLYFIADIAQRPMDEGEE